MLRQFPNTECRAIHTLFCYTPTKKILLSCERTPAYRGGSFLLQREQHYSSEELLRLTLSPQA